MGFQSRCQSRFGGTVVVVVIVIDMANSSFRMTDGDHDNDHDNESI
jgi:hypothetical protein